MDKNDNKEIIEDSEKVKTGNNEELSNLNINDFCKRKINNKEIVEKINNDEKITNKNKNNNKNLNIFNEKDILINIELRKKEKASIEYEKIIKNNPNELFKIITKETIEKWKNILYKKVKNIIKEDCNILNSENSKENIKIVSNDIPRTRVREKNILNCFSSLLDYFISYYCMDNSIIYKQGLNEIIAPFLLLKYKLPNIPFHEIYNLFSGFINTFAPNYFYEKTFYGFKNSLSLLILLLKYHAPSLQNLFDNLLITPEMYATNWLLTIFSGKLSLHLIYYLMNKIIIEDDPLIIHYLIVALLIHKKEMIFQSDLTMVPVVISSISIDYIDEIDKIYNIAIGLREKTPYSFKILANHLEIFKCYCENPKEIYEKYKPDKLLTLPIFPSEIFYICYRGVTKCPDDSCKNNTKNKDKNDDINDINKQRCEFCDMKIKKDLNYILLDLRILEFEGQDEKISFLPKVVNIEQKTLKNKNFTDLMVERFNEDKGKSHFIFMSSKTDFFNEFEENFYIESSQDNNFFNIPIKIDKEINKDLVNKMSLTERFKLKEYDNMKKLLLALLENDFPYISFIYGGFETIHEDISKYNTDINLLNHDNNCEICKSKIVNNNSWFSKFMKKSKSFLDNLEIIKDKKENNNNSYIQRLSSSINFNTKRSADNLNHKKYISMDALSDLISNDENFVKYCSLLKYGNNEYNEDDNQGILIIKKYFLIIIKMQGNEKAEQVDKIIITFIEKAEIKKKNYLNIDFIDNDKNKFSLYVKFELEQDAKKFLIELNKAKQ